MEDEYITSIRPRQARILHKNPMADDYIIGDYPKYTHRKQT
jgi:hypothetical protein